MGHVGIMSVKVNKYSKCTYSQLHGIPAGVLTGVECLCECVCFVPQGLRLE